MSHSNEGYTRGHHIPIAGKHSGTRLTELTLTRELLNGRLASSSPIMALASLTKGKRSKNSSGCFLPVSLRATNDALLLRGRQDLEKDLGLRPLALA